MTTEPKIHSGHIELAVAMLFDYRKYVLVPNVSFGWGLSYEADLLAVMANKVTEIEVKISISDLRADFKKAKHLKPSPRVGRLVYAMPEGMVAKAMEMIPAQHGIIAVKWNKYGYEALWVRQCRHRSDYKGVSDQDVMKLMRLADMRIWSLKEHNNNKKKS